jgi:hypothetical protein
MKAGSSTSVVHNFLHRTGILHRLGGGSVSNDRAETLAALLGDSLMACDQYRIRSAILTIF